MNFGSLGLLRYTEESFLFNIKEQELTAPALLLLRQDPAVPVTEQQSILAKVQGCSKRSPVHCLISFHHGLLIALHTALII